jgi:hypothetical protein
VVIMLKRLRTEQRGATMVITAALITVLLLFAGLALDFGRAYLLKAQLQTALDAASLAGALQVVPMVELTIERWRASEDVCTDPVTQKPYNCLNWDSASPSVVSGPRWDLIEQGKWRTRAGAQCTWPYRCGSPRITKEWLILPPTTVPKAQQTFYMNARWPQGTELSPRVEDLSISTDPTKVQVTATARMSAPTTFLKLVGIKQMQFVRKGSAVPVKR